MDKQAIINIDRSTAAEMHPYVYVHTSYMGMEVSMYVLPCIIH